MIATHRLAVLLAEAEEQFDPNTVSPGVQGFIWTAVFALAVILLGFSLVRRLRRNAYRHQIREEIDAELAAQESGGDAPGGASSDQAPGPDTDRG